MAKMKNVIVDGATGFLGRYFVNLLLNKDIKVTALVRNINKLNFKSDIFGLIQIVETDFEDIKDVINTLAGENYDSYYHLAWAGVSSKDKNNEKLQINNIHMALNALEICNKLKCHRFIFCGSVAEYGLIDGVIDDTVKQSPGDLYGAAKVSCDYFLKVKSNQLGIEYIHIIIPSLYGEGREESNIISYTIKTLILSETPHYGELNKLWDFLYVGDASLALYLIGERGISGKSYGISSGIYKPLKNYIEDIRDMINPKADLDIGVSQRLTNQSLSSCVNGYELIKDTGFAPTVTFKEGIKRMIEYYRFQYGGVKSN